MEETLKQLGFINASDESHIGYYKTYKGFRLFVARSTSEDKWGAVITVGKMEISIPLLVDKYWVYGFNEENGGEDYSCEQ